MSETVNNLDEIVDLVMEAYTMTHADTISPLFELRVRKALMRRFCAEVYQRSATWTGMTPPSGKTLLNG